jgi:hypothetical protein
MAAFSDTLRKLLGYFNPTSNQGKNFWSTPVAQGLGKVQQTIRPAINTFNKLNTPSPVQQKYIIQPAQNFINTYIRNPQTKEFFPKAVTKDTTNMWNLNNPIYHKLAIGQPITKVENKSLGSFGANIGMSIGGNAPSMASSKLAGIFDSVRMRELAPDIKKARSLLSAQDLFKQEDQIASRNFIDSVLAKIGHKPTRELQKIMVAQPQEYISYVKGLFDDALYAAGHPELKLGMSTKAIQREVKPAPQTPVLKQTLEQPAGQKLMGKELKGLKIPSSESIVASGTRERGLVTSVKGAEGITKLTKTKVSGSYKVKPDTQLMGEAQALLNEGVSIDFKNTKNLDQKVVATIKQAINLDKTGTAKGHQAAANLYNNLSEHATEFGRGVHAFSMLDKMSPEAIALSAAGKIKKYNLTATRKIPELTGEQQSMISSAVAKIDRLSGRKKNIAINDLTTKINEFIPSSLTDKIITTWKAGLLTSLRTHERNLLGNSIMGGSEVVKDIPATMTDLLMSLKTGKRTTTFTTKTGGGWKKGLQSAKDIVTTGFDPEASISKYEVKQINWGKNPVEQALKGYTDAVFRTLGGEDKPFWQASFGRSLYDQAGAEAINAGKTGNKAFMENLVKSPTEQMLTTATKDANVATFHDPNKLSGLASKIKGWAKEKWYTKLPAEVLAPFTGVPSSIVGKTVAYSPIGLLKGSIDVGRVILGKTPIPELQRQAAQEVGRGVMGTALFGLGAYLMSKGLMTGQPKDATESRQWTLEGKQANSVLVGGKWRSINSIGPQNLVVLAGAKYNEEMGKPEGSLGAYGLGLGQDQLSQTFLSGLQQPLNAITDPNRYGKSYAGNMMASVIPNIVKDTSKVFDPNMREMNKTTDYVKLGIPGVRNTLLPKRDALGNIVPQEPTGAGAFVDLFNSKTPISNIVVDELSRLNETGNNATPGTIGKSQTINGTKMTLTPEQLDVFESQVGQQAMTQLQELFTSVDYQSLTDEDKSKSVDSLMTKIRKGIRSTIDLGIPLTNTPTATTATKTTTAKKTKTAKSTTAKDLATILKKVSSLKSVTYKMPSTKVTQPKVKLLKLSSLKALKFKGKKLTLKKPKMPSL